jgi:hypothetical protein
MLTNVQRGEACQTRWRAFRTLWKLRSRGHSVPAGDAPGRMWTRTENAVSAYSAIVEVVRRLRRILGKETNRGIRGTRGRRTGKKSVFRVFRVFRG